MLTEIAASFPKFPLAMKRLARPLRHQPSASVRQGGRKSCPGPRHRGALTKLPASEQWDLVYPAWRPWLGRQLAAFGVPERFVPAIVAGDVPKDAANLWESVPRESRQHVESLFTGLLLLVRQNRTLYQQTSAAWLALVARDKAANARTGRYFRAKLAAASDLGEIEVIAVAAHGNPQKR